MRAIHEQPPLLKHMLQPANLPALSAAIRKRLVMQQDDTIEGVRVDRLRRFVRQVEVCQEVPELGVQLMKAGQSTVRWHIGQFE